MRDEKVNERMEKEEEEELGHCIQCQDEVAKDSNPPDLCESCAWNIFTEQGPEGFNEY